MSFETGMVTALQSISGLKVYPNYAQEGTTAPYVIYEKGSTEYERSLEGINSQLDGITYQLNLIADNKSQMETYADLIETKLLSLYQTTTGGEYIQDIEILSRYNQYEPEIEKFREIIEFKVTY